MLIFGKIVRFLSLSVLVLGACGASPMGSSVNTVSATEVAQVIPTNLFLPALSQSYPLQTPFGATLKPVDSQGGLDAMAAAGSQWVRIDFPWAVVQPTEGASLQWESVQWVEQGIINAANAGMETILIITDVPDWALKSGFAECGPVAQNKNLALGSFLTQAIQRYSPRPYSVRYWELWNEPDLAGSYGCWGDNSDPDYHGGAYYGEMLKVIYPHIKSINRDAQVLVGGLLMPCIPTEGISNPSEPCKKPETLAMSRFMEGILKSGAGGSFDGIGFHAYDWYDNSSNQIGMYGNADWNSTQSSGPSSIRKAQYIKNLLNQYGVTNKYLVNTETALFCDVDEAKQTCTSLSNFPQSKAYYLVQSYTVALAEGWKANLWYTATGARGSGLLIGPQLTPDPAYYSFKFTRTMLQNSAFLRRPPVPSGISAYEFNRGDRLVWVLWSTNGTPLPVALDKAPSAIYEIGQNGDGAPAVDLPGAGGSVLVGVAPVFIEFMP